VVCAVAGGLASRWLSDRLVGGAPDPRAERLPRPAI